MTVRLCLVSLLVAVSSSSAKMMEELASMNQQAQTAPKSAPFKACIDDSDCSDRGSGFACFQYICYPWSDDSAIKSSDRKKTCKSNDNCPDGLSCFRHHDRRQIHRGLCMEPITDCSENGRDDCAQRECCNGQYCCGQEYFDQLKQLPCVNHLGCKDLGYGNFCCPPKGLNSTEPAQCCNEDPSPTTTTTTTTPSPRKAASKVNAAPATSVGSIVLLGAFFLLAVLRY
jgi:hypothetical protein